ncbi:hypothetical protein TSUD_74070 [Trifolium subterraneum]|uniref:Uncharacterized protein n=1 Tax=Trifolium subterraneum TaxID=3900 RepID=A0A2Z6PGT8_TRISU|nr:hypothetical protein TSUD_74070 [Trifolium subterraneum]
MEEFKYDTRKRVRDDSDLDSPDSKRVLRVATDSNNNSSESHLSRVNSTGSCSDSFESELVSVEPDSYEVNNEIKDEILNILDETENVTEPETVDTTVQGLEFVMKSFEDEIFAQGQDSDPNYVPESNEFNPNLGYLLEASDDELGLPPTVVQHEEKEKEFPEINHSGRVGPDGVDLSGFFWFEEDIRNNEAFGFGGYEAVTDENGGGYVTIDGLFDYSEPADILWRSETLQAM